MQGKKELQTELTYPQLEKQRVTDQDVNTVLGTFSSPCLQVTIAKPSLPSKDIFHYYHQESALGTTDF